MSEPQPSLNQLTAKVEKLGALLSFHPQDHAWLAPSPTPELGPEPWLDDQALERLVQARQTRLAEAEADQIRRGGLIVKAEASLVAQAAGLETPVQAARSALAAAESDLARLETKLNQASRAARQSRDKAQQIEKWLAGIAPAGLQRFRDTDGRELSEPDLLRTQDRLRQLRQQTRDHLEQARTLMTLRQRRQAGLDRCRQELEQALAARREGEARLHQQAEALAQRQADLARDAAELGRIRQDLARALACRDLHHQVLTELGALIAAAMPPAPPEDRSLTAARQELERAADQAARAARLDVLLRRLDLRLQEQNAPTLGLMARSREINRELRNLEQDLPRHLAPLTSPDTASPPARSGAAAGLSLLTARLEDLAPEARAAHGELKAQKERLGRWVERGKEWQDAWRAAAKAERVHLEQAEALIAEARLAAQELSQRADQAQAQLRPLLELARSLRSADLLPLARAAQERLDDCRGVALVMEEEADQLLTELPGPSVGSLSRPPAALKPHASLLRRLSGHRVEVERLTAMLRAARGWRGLLSEPVLAAARRPAEEVALSLAASLRRLAQERARLLEGRGRAAMRLVALRQSLGQERLAAANQAQVLLEGERRLRSLQARNQALLNELNAAREEHRLRSQDAQLRLARLEAELSQSGQIRAAAQAEARQLRISLSQSRLTVAELENRLEATVQDLASQGRMVQELGRDLAQEREAVELARHHLGLAQGRNYRLKKKVELLDNQLALARQGQLTAAQLMARLERTDLDQVELVRRLEQSQRLAAALKAKSLERHRLYRQALAALEPLEYWRSEAQAREERSQRLAEELREARHQLEQAQAEIKAAHAARDLAKLRLAQEQTARARQALDLLQGQGLALELSASQGEAQRWADLARDLALALTLTGQSQAQEVAELRLQAAEQAAQAQHLRQQLDRLAWLVALTSAPNRSGDQAGGPLRVRITSLTPAQLERITDRLNAVRGRLKQIGRTTIGYWALVAALTAGLVLVAPNTPSKATRRVSPLVPPAQAVQQAGASLGLGGNLNLAASGKLLAPALGSAELELNLLPLRQRPAPLTGETRSRLAALARRAGLSPQVLLTSAQAAFGDSEMVDAKALEQLAETAHDLARRHPLIFRELASKGLPKNAADLAALDPSPEKAQQLFLDRLYREYRSLGFSPEEALGALTANERAAAALADAWQTPNLYLGQVQLVAEVETLTLAEFMTRITPYIETRLNGYLRGGGVSFTGDVGLYAKNLAFDIYCAAKKFQVPVSLMLVIAHQESSYANVLGDSNRSASPFQIFAPTRKLIVNSLARNRFVPPPADLRLEHHLTMATYMAAFHLRELLMESVVNPGGGRAAHVDLDRVMKRYNGSDIYAGQVAQRQKQLVSFLRNS